VVILLIYVAVGLLAALVTAVVDDVIPLSRPVLLGLWILLVVLIDRIAGHAPRGRASRPVPADPAARNPPLPPGNGRPKWTQWYIESQPPGCRLQHSCSFVEFDERGDYLDFYQHQDALTRARALARAGPLTLVIFVHGWRHSGQSGNVVDFNEFLHQLADGGAAGQGRRVHGLYLAWRGAALRPVITRDATFANVTRCYGEPIVDVERSARLPLLNEVLESLSYWDRKSIPEHKFSGTALSRTIFSCADAVRREQADCQVVLAGHSFGGLMLERTFQNAAISQLVGAWPWGQPPPGQQVDPLPFNTILLINSAAPSIYAKQFQGFLAAHRQAMVAQHVPDADVPIVFSMTSSADWATGLAHPAANALAGLLPTLWRWYRGDDFILEDVPANTGPNVIMVPQAYYYRHTPGHNPLLVNRFIEPLDQTMPPSVGAERGGHVRGNLLRATSQVRAGQFEAGSRWWQVNVPPRTRVFDRFSRYRGRRPLVWTREVGRYPYADTAYWIVRCPKEIIAGHNDIWSQAAMDTYAALHRIANP
jgi:hypothetical protein